MELATHLRAPVEEEGVEEAVKHQVAQQTQTQRRREASRMRVQKAEGFEENLSKSKAQPNMQQTMIPGW